MKETAGVLAATGVIVAGAVGAAAVLTHGFKTPIRTVYHEAAVFRLHPGECLDMPNGSSLTVVSCTAPHDAEVSGTFTLPGPAWPGAATVRREASDGCGTLLSQYLDPQLSTALEQSYVYPSQADWSGGTRKVVCEVRAARGELTGSVSGGIATTVAGG